MATDPDGPCDLIWSPDGRSVQLSPRDQRQNLHWGFCSLPADGLSAADQKTSIPAAPPLFELQWSDGQSQKSALLLFDKRQKKNRPLQNTPWNLFGFEMLDSIDSRWRFQDSRFSPDWREVSIIAAGTIYTWSTSTGKLLRQVHLTAPQMVDENYLFASFSPGGRFVVSSLAHHSSGEQSGAALFDAKSGHRIFTIPGSQGARFWVGFLVGQRLLVSQDSAPKGNETIASIWSVQQRRVLWSCPMRKSLQVLPHSNLVLVPRETKVELRDFVTGKLQNSLPYPAEFMAAIAPSPDGSRIWTSYANGQIWSWRVQ